MKYLIVGLGNPGDKYENTRHNIGFKVLDSLIKPTESNFESDKLGWTCKYKFKGRTLFLLKPSTFMNLSGKSLNYWLKKEKILLENVLVITDDIALPFGKLRLKGKGSDAGHNGLKDIIEHLNTNQFARLKFGVGNDYPRGHQAEYVLSDWGKEEIDVLEERIDQSLEFIKGFCTIGLGRTMSALNNK